ncbi:MAG: DMT family transporter [Acidobacteriota bacterium]
MGGAARDFIVLILVNLMWAVQFPAAKIATAELGPITVTSLPLLAATLILAPILLFRARFAQGTKVTKPRDVPRAVADFAIIGVAGTLVAQLFLVWGVQRSLASNASVISLSIPVVSAILAVILLSERMTRVRWISFTLAIAGVLLVSDIEWGSLRILHGDYLLGNLLIFGSCWGGAFYNVFSKKLLRRFDPLQVLVYSFVASNLILVPMMFRYEPLSWNRLASLKPAVWISLGAIAVFTLALAMILFLWVLERLDAMQASLSIYFLPVFGVILSALTVKEKITMRLLLGGGLVLVGTFLVTVYEQKKRSVP